MDSVRAKLKLLNCIGSVRANSKLVELCWQYDGKVKAHGMWLCEQLE